MEAFTTREQITEVVNKLFVYTDYLDWDKLLREVFTEVIDFDMASIGGEVRSLPAKDVCDSWKKGFEGIDAVNHLAGNYIVTINGGAAEVFAYATATHFRKSATAGQTREFVGSYNLRLIQTPGGWRIGSFKYNLKYAAGNLELK